MLETGIDAGESLRLAAGFIEAALGIHGRDPLATTENVDDGPFVPVVRIVVLRVGLANQGVGSDVDLVPEAHFLFNFFIEGRPDNPYEYEGDAEVDDVSAVTASVAVA